MYLDPMGSVAGVLPYTLNLRITRMSCSFAPSSQPFVPDNAFLKSDTEACYSQYGVHTLPVACCRPVTKLAVCGSDLVAHSATFSCNAVVSSRIKTYLMGAVRMP